MCFCRQFILLVLTTNPTVKKGGKKKVHEAVPYVPLSSPFSSSPPPGINTASSLNNYRASQPSKLHYRAADCSIADFPIVLKDYPCLPEVVGEL